MSAAKISTPLTLSKARILTDQDLKKGDLNGSITSSAYDTVCISNVSMVGDTFIQTGQPSTRIFTVADGHLTPGSTMEKLHHPVR